MTNLNAYLVACFSSKKAKQHFIIDIVLASSQQDAEKKVLNRVYFRDFEERNILAKCKKAETIRQIN